MSTNLETGVLGAVIHSPKFLDDIQHLQLDHMATPAGRRVLHAMREIFSELGTVDSVLLWTKLPEDISYVQSLTNSFVGVETALAYANRLISDWERGQAIRELARAQLALQEGADLGDVVAKLSLTSGGSGQFNTGVLTAVEGAAAALESGETQAGISSGLEDLDRLTGGFKPGEIIIVAARPGMGKSALALNVAEEAWIAGKSVVYFSFEMSRGELAKRLIRSMAEIRTTGPLPEREKHLVRVVADTAKSFRGAIIDTAIGGLPMVERECRAIATKVGLDLVIVDYVQLMSVPGHANRATEIGEISRGLKILAQRLQVPILVLSQLNRAIEATGPKGERRRPQLSDLRDSGALEQDADVVLFVHRQEQVAKDEGERMRCRGQAEIIIGKQRNGPLGTVYCRFEAERTKFAA